VQGGGLCFFVSLRIFFTDNTRIRILIFFQNLTLGYMTKTLNQIIFFTQLLVPPSIVYASSIWDPYTRNNIHQLKAIQRRAARFVYTNVTTFMMLTWRRVGGYCVPGDDGTREERISICISICIQCSVGCTTLNIEYSPDGKTLFSKDKIRVAIRKYILHSPTKYCHLISFIKILF
jgi:hypothetical protein